MDILSLLTLDCSTGVFWKESGGLTEEKKTKKKGTIFGLTGSAFVPDNEVFAAARTLVRPKDAAVDKDLTAPSVLALIQHFLRDKE